MRDQQVERVHILPRPGLCLCPPHGFPPQRSFQTRADRLGWINNLSTHLWVGPLPLFSSSHPLTSADSSESKMQGSGEKRSQSYPYIWAVSSGDDHGLSEPRADKGEDPSDGHGDPQKVWGLVKPECSLSRGCHVFLDIPHSIPY